MQAEYARDVGQGMSQGGFSVPPGLKVGAPSGDVPAATDGGEAASNWGTASSMFLFIYDCSRIFLVQKCSHDSN